MVQLRERNLDELYISNLPQYVPGDSFEKFALGYAFRSSCILQGPKGVGKTLTILEYAREHKVPVVSVDCAEDLRRSHLMGFFVMEGDQTPFIEGPLLTAIRAANALGKCILLFEEMNALAPQTQKLLNPLTDFRKKLEVPEISKTYALEGELWVVGTMNFSSYGGVYQINEDLKSRFRIIPVDYPEEDHEIRILKRNFPNYDEGYLRLFIQLAQDTRNTKNISYCLSTRDLLQVLEDMEVFSQEDALSMLIGKLDEEEASYLKQRIQSIFG